MSTTARRIVLFACALLFLLPAHAVFAEKTPQKKTILILHSYNREYRWTEDINDGIMKALSSYARPSLVCTEYLDWKRFPSERTIEDLYGLFKDKYRNVPIDAIVTSDDKALAFAAKYRKELFSDAPIVFTGVYPESVEGLTGGAKNVTGVYEEQDIRTTVEFALKIQQNASAAYIISDLNESGQAVERHIRDTLKELAPKLPVWSLSELPIASIEDFVSTLKMRDIVMIGSYSIDKSGETYTGETLIGRVGMASRTPVYILNTHHLGTGAFGGNLLSPVLLGENAGKLALKILDGVPADSLAPLSKSSYTPMFDYDTVKRLGISPFFMPAGAVYLNREPSFTEKYWKELLWILALFAILLSFLYVTFANYRRTRKLARNLAERNDEISLLNDSLSQSEEELRQQFSEITIIKETLEESEERYRLSSIGSNDALWDWRYTDRRVHYSARWYEMTGFDPEKKADIQIEDIIHPEDKEAFKAAFQAHLDGITDHFRCEARIRIASGRYKWVLLRGKIVKNEKNVTTRFAGSITDIDDRKQKEAEIENLAFFDQLTSLPNRTQSLDLARALIEATKEGQTCALMFIDIDNFKYINDTFGHPVGDKVLIQTAKALSSLVNEKINIARFGGDEFILLVSDTNGREMEKLGKLAITLLGRKMEIDGRLHFLTASAGIALYPEHAASIGELFQKADAALHRAKQTGKTRYFMFDDSIQRELLKRMDLERGLRDALENNEIHVAYQPQISLSSKKIAGFEALARWSSPGRGSVPPSEFIPVAEETGQIGEIGLFILHSALKFIKRAELVGYSEFTVSINVSVKQLHERDFVRNAIRILQAHEVSPRRIVLEITESFMIDELDPVIERLNELRDAGFILSLDDFGKGYSSLSYLRTLPISFIKIDKVFIDDILAEGSSEPLAKTIIVLSHELGLKVVAEGVEEEAQMVYLRDHDCDIIQGYYYSKPGSEDTVLGQLSLAFE